MKAEKGNNRKLQSRELKDILNTVLSTENLFITLLDIRFLQVLDYNKAYSQGQIALPENSLLQQLLPAVGPAA